MSAGRHVVGLVIHPSSLTTPAAKGTVVLVAPSSTSERRSALGLTLSPASGAPDPPFAWSASSCTRVRNHSYCEWPSSGGTSAHRRDAHPAPYTTGNERNTHIVHRHNTG